MHPHLLRRLAAIVYDSLLLFGVLSVATFPVLLMLGGDAVAPGNPAYLGYLLVLSYAYFASAWTRSGQTLGMKSWRIRLIGRGGERVSALVACWRFTCALLSWCPFGAGFLWSLIDKERRCWHDVLSRTELILVA